MKFLVLSDLHANNSMLDKLDAEFSKADAVLFAGDFAECFKSETGKAALEKLVSKHESIYAVLGNCDNIDFMEELEKQDICVEKTLVFHVKCDILQMIFESTKQIGDDTENSSDGTFGGDGFWLLDDTACDARHEGEVLHGYLQRGLCDNPAGTGHGHPRHLHAGEAD